MFWSGKLSTKMKATTFVWKNLTGKISWAFHRETWTMVKKVYLNISCSNIIYLLIYLAMFSFSIWRNSWNRFIFIVFSGSVVLGMIYKDLHQLFITNQTENSTLNNSRSPGNYNYTFIFHLCMHKRLINFLHARNWRVFYVRQFISISLLYTWNGAFEV